MAILFKNTSPAAFFLGSKTISKVLFKDNAVWENGPNLNYPLCFTAEQANSTIKMKASANAPTVYLETSPTCENGSWTDFTVGSTTITLANVGDKVYFRAKQNNERFGTFVNFYNQFVMTGKIAASGNINTLLKANGSVLDLTGRDYCFVYLFKDCNSLTNATELFLPATQLAMSCYYGLFENCSNLVNAPTILPANNLILYCYYGMFSGCTVLKQAPELPATTLAEACYANMFRDCTSLTQAPELPATTLASSCYNCMFYGCTSLTQAPELPATTLADACYLGMFYNCSALTQAPELPATTLVMLCYDSMFQYCTSLTQAPELPATTLAGECYQHMFSDCYNLQSMYFSNWNYDEAKSNLTNTDYCQDMFANITTYNVQVQLNDGNTYMLTELLKSDSLPYLKFTNNDDDYQGTADIKLASYDSPNNTPQLEYSTDDGNNWNTFNINETYTIDSGNSMCIRASSNASYDSYFSDSNGYYKFESSYGPKLTVEGNLKYLLNQDDNYNSVKQTYTFRNLFQNFQYFHSDSNITIPYPDKAAEGYSADYCYQYMFDNSNINKITLADNFTSWYDEYGNDRYWTENWVYNVSSTNDYGNSGTFYCSSNLNQEFSASRIPDGWIVETF